MATKPFVNSIIIVEDNRSLNHLLQIKLQELGYETEGYETGEDTIKRLQENQDVLLIIDYHLSDMLAIEVINELKEKKLNIPFVVMTGEGNEGLAVEMMRLGALDYIVKELGFIDHIPAILNRCMKHLETRSKLIKVQDKIKRSEEKYRSIFENIQDIYFEMDQGGMITEISPSVKSILLYDRQEVLGMDLSDLMVKEELLKSFIQRIVAGDVLEDYEIEFHNKEGETKNMAIKARLKDDSGVLIGTMHDITIRKKLERQIINSVIETEENERKRFSEDLHDGLGPLLSSIKLYVNMLSSSHDEKKRANLVQYTNELLDDAISSTRSIANNLMPNVLSDFGIVPALESFCKKINMTDKTKIDINSNFDERMDEAIEIVLYRTIMELINNTLKHASAKRINIEFLKESDKLYVEYKDDGVGFDYEEIINNEEKKGMGLNNIKSRISSINGKCQIFSKPEKGIQVTMELNL